MRWKALGGGALAWLSACATAGGSGPGALATPQDKPAYRTIHQDNMDPSHFEQFEGARKEFLQALKETGGTDHRGWYFQVDRTGFLSMRPLARFAELDQRLEAFQQGTARVPRAVLDRYDERSDTVLEFPHRSQLWAVEDELGYAAPGGPGEWDAGFGRLVVEDVNPAPPHGLKAYSEAWEQVARALAAARYPLTRVSYWPVYGTGQLVTLWLAHSREEFQRAPSLEEALRQQLGPDKARELVEAMQRCVLRSEAHELLPRPDLNSP